MGNRAWLSHRHQLALHPLLSPSYRTDISLPCIRCCSLGQDMMVSTGGASPIVSLFKSLHELYAPLLLRDPTWSSRLDPKLQTLLTELDTQLGNTLRAGGTSWRTVFFVVIVSLRR